MKTYKVEGKSVTVANGKVKLNKDQARRRRYLLDEGKRGVFQVKTPLTFKAGEVFGWDQKVSKSMGKNLVAIGKPSAEAPAGSDESESGAKEPVDLSQAGDSETVETNETVDLTHAGEGQV